MAYKISEGISVQALPKWLKNAAKEFGTFEDGRVDYTNADVAPIVMCSVVYRDKILIVKRGYGLADANGYWSTINGFIDENKSIKNMARQELEEEIGLKINTQNIKLGTSYTLKNPKEKRAYIVFPCLIITERKPKIVLNSENTDFAWISRSELENYHILDDLPEAVDAALRLL